MSSLLFDEKSESKSESDSQKITESQEKGQEDHVEEEMEEFDDKEGEFDDEEEGEFDDEEEGDFEDYEEDYDSEEGYDEEIDGERDEEEENKEEEEIIIPERGNWGPKLEGDFADHLEAEEERLKDKDDFDWDDAFNRTEIRYRALLRDKTGRWVHNSIKERMYELNASDPKSWDHRALSQKFGYQLARVKPWVEMKRIEKMLLRQDPEFYEPWFKFVERAEEQWEEGLSQIYDYERNPEIAEPENRRLVRDLYKGHSLWFREDEVPERQLQKVLIKSNHRNARVAPFREKPRTGSDYNPQRDAPVKILEFERQLNNPDTYYNRGNFVCFIDTSPKVKDIDRVIMMRQPNGNLRTVTWEERVFAHKVWRGVPGNRSRRLRNIPELDSELVGVPLRHMAKPIDEDKIEDEYF